MPARKQLPERLVRLDLEPLAEGGYVATSPDLSGLVAQGRTIAETMDIARDVARKMIESYLEHGDAPAPLRELRSRRIRAVVPVSLSGATAAKRARTPPSRVRPAG